MGIPLRVSAVCTALVAALPAVAYAQDAAAAVGLFNAFVGLMLVVALLSYGGGFLMWMARLGTWPSYRTEAIKIMEWSVVILFVLVLLLGIVQFFQKHKQAGAYMVSILAALLVLWLIIYFASQGGKEEKKEKR